MPPSPDDVPFPGDEHLWALGFPAWQEVRGRHSVADLYRPRRRCGLYVLGFSNGERYVGQAVDVVRRFAQHRHTHPDLTHLTFQPCPPAELDVREQHAIHILEGQQLRLRNLAHMSVVTGERDLDLVVKPEKQVQWLTGDADGLHDAQTGVQDADLRRRTARRFADFMALPQAQAVLRALGTYLQAVVPFPRRTELTFWMVSCLPYGADAASQLRCRVSLNMQEVLSLHADETDVFAVLHLAASPLREALGETWEAQLAEHGWIFDHHRYAPGGHDQFRLQVDSLSDLLGILTDWPFSQGMALLNLRLMRKGPTYYGRSHCLDLVDAAIQSVDTP